MPLRKILPILFAAAAFQTVSAQDWAQWRGPSRDGVAMDFVAPAQWPEKLKLIWKTEVGSGYASPVVSKDRAWIHTRKGEEEAVSCLDLKTGKIIWSKRSPAAFTKNQYATEAGKGPHSTPVLYDGNLYTLGVTAILSCFDADSGELKWRREFGAPDTSKMFCGTAFSPVVDQGNLIIYTGDDIKGGAMFALDPATGKERWKWTGEGPGYASPIVVEIEGARQIVTMTDKSIIGVELKTGKLLWRMPWPDEWNENIVTPISYKNTLIFSGVRKGTVAAQVTKNGAEWSVKQIWHNPEIAMYMNSPVLEGDYLFGMSSKRKGQYFCMEAATGKVLWATEGREGANAAILNVRDALLILTNDANLIVAKKSSKGFEQVAKYSVADSPTYAHPAPVGKMILVKDGAAMALWSLE
ncbi:MAG TPA: PQQ-binding-like beta-propeller repeat protein [Blastocatellia bacterium]